jgi:hypothetical protein
MASPASKASKPPAPAQPGPDPNNPARRALEGQELAVPSEVDVENEVQRALVAGDSEAPQQLSLVRDHDLACGSSSTVAWVHRPGPGHAPVQHSWLHARGLLVPPASASLTA